MIYMLYGYRVHVLCIYMQMIHMGVDEICVLHTCCGCGGCGGIHELSVTQFGVRALLDRRERGHTYVAAVIYILGESYGRSIYILHTVHEVHI